MKTTLVRWRFALALVAAVGLTACAGGAQEKPPSANVEDSQRFVVLDASLGDRLEISNAVQRYRGDIATGMVALQSTHFLTLNFQYRFAWYDQDGFELELESKAWKPASIPAKGVLTLKTTAPNPAAASFKIFVQ